MCADARPRELIPPTQERGEDARIPLPLPLLTPSQLLNLHQRLWQNSRWAAASSHQGGHLCPCPWAQSRRVSLAKHHLCRETTGSTPLLESCLSLHQPFSGAHSAQTGKRTLGSQTSRQPRGDEGTEGAHRQAAE